MPMNLRTKFSRLLQGKNTTYEGRNLIGFRALCQAGFTPGEARRALVAANKIKVKHLALASLARGEDITAPTIYAAIYGIRPNKRGREIISQALQIPLKDLFPEDRQ